MPNRILKESICYSDDIDKLSWFEEVVFYRLLVRCDDYGRLDARPSFLKSMLFATKAGITDKGILDALRKLASVGLVGLYEVDGKPILSILNWSKHQRIRDSKAKYPEPPENVDFAGLMTTRGDSRQLAANGGELRPQSQSESQSKSESKTPLTPQVGNGYDYFADFWAEYPRKVAKAEAAKAFRKLAMTDELMEKVMDSLSRAMESEQWKKDGGQYIPYPATWINQRRWEDGS